MFIYLFPFPTIKYLKLKMTSLNHRNHDQLSRKSVIQKMSYSCVCHRPGYLLFTVNDEVDTLSCSGTNNVNVRVYLFYLETK